MLKNINPYDPVIFESQFKQTPLYQKLSTDFDQLLFDNNNAMYNRTPRQELGDPKCRKSVFSVVPFYYLNWLDQENPTNIYDLGCGWNIFKKYIPNIIGVGAEDPGSGHFFGDIHDFVDDHYIQEHQHFFKSMFSICALHFFPLSNIRQQIIKIGSMLQSNGQCWLAFNLARMLERDNTKFGNYSELQLENYIRSELFDLPFEVQVFDLDLSNSNQNNTLNGNINIIFKLS